MWSLFSALAHGIRQWVLSIALVEIITGKKPAKQGLDEAAVQAQKILDEFNKSGKIKTQ